MTPYQPADGRDPMDQLILAFAGPEPEFDPVTRDFLVTSNDELRARCQGGGLLQFASLGRLTPWLYRLTFQTRGLGHDEQRDEVLHVEGHTIVLRFDPEYLRRARRERMLHYMGPRRPAPFHPNICPRTGAICLEVYPGEPLIAIAESLHDLLRWRIRQLAEHDALNKAACSYGRSFITGPLDERSLFGSAVAFTFQPVEGSA